MTVEQVLKVLEDMKAMLDERQALHLSNAEIHEANARRMEERNPMFYKGNIIACREWSAQQNERAADCAEKKRYIDHAIAIIKTAQQWAIVKPWYDENPFDTKYEMRHVENALLSLLSSELAKAEA